MTSLLNIAANSPAEDEVEEGQSLRFNDDDSPYLSLTPSSAGNQDVWTFSAWVKRGNPYALYPTIFSAGTTTTDRFLFRFTADTLNVFWRDANTSNRNLTTNALYRDYSAWYHVVLAVDTTDATTANRMRLYVNGDEVTSFSADNRSTLSSGSTLAVNDAVLHTIGTRAYSVGNYYEGYIANACFIDGQQLDPTSFGEYKNTLWKPKSDAAVQALTFGTNGFYLNFEDSSAIGDDTSGNANDWTANSLAATDVVLDGAYNGGNFATLNALTYAGASALTLFEGNLKAREATGVVSWKSLWSTFAAPTSGKWYAEFYLTYTGSTGFTYQAFAGLHDGLAATTYIGQSSGSYGYIASGDSYNNGSQSAYGATYGNGDIIGVAWDADNGDLTFYKNGVSQGIAYSSVSAENKFFGVSAIWVSPDGQTYWHCNFGQDSSFAGNLTAQGNTDDNGVGDFYYAPPSGFLALTTGNLPAATITAPDEYFNTLLWTGDGASSRSLTGVNFQPDFNWVKSRSDTSGHVLHDSVRGSDAGGLIVLTSQDTDAESAFDSTWHSSFGSLDSLDSDGFTVTDGSLAGNYNTSGTAYVAWNWLASNSTSSIAVDAYSAGVPSIASTVSANQTAGFSVVSWTATNGTATIGHGLNSAPEMIIVKDRDTATNWTVYHGSLGNTGGLLLNAPDGFDTNINYWNNTSPTSSVFSVGLFSNYLTDAHIAYCFHSVEGYSKIGSYTGNGSTDGTFVHCGFRPAWVMIKRTDSTGNWRMYDNERVGYNVVDDSLQANLSNAEDSNNSFNSVDFTSNGFKLRGNAGGDTNDSASYIFLAFAEAPFKSANAR